MNLFQSITDDLDMQTKIFCQKILTTGSGKMTFRPKLYEIILPSNSPVLLESNLETLIVSNSPKNHGSCFKMDLANILTYLLYGPFFSLLRNLWVFSAPNLNYANSVTILGMLSHGSSLPCFWGW